MTVELSALQTSRYLLMSGSPGLPDDYLDFTHLLKPTEDAGIHTLQRMTAADEVVKRPTKTVVRLTMTQDQEAQYDVMLTEACAANAAGRLKPYLQLCEHREKVSGWKVPIVLRGLETCKHVYTVVFSEFNSTLAQIASHFTCGRHADVEVFCCFGRTSHAHHDAVTKFCLPAVSEQDQTKCVLRRKFLLCNVATASHGTDLGRAQLLVAVDGVYTRRDMLQMEGRVTRIGQSPSQEIVQLVHMGTFEETLLLGNSQQVNMS